MEKLYDLYVKKLKTVTTGFVRYLYEKINWDSQLIVIMGARGVGKTTMVLQHILMTDTKKDSLYIAADNTYFAANTLYDTATKFAQQGGKILYIDEIHKYQNWSKEVKMMYDYLPDQKVVVTGSSILELIKGTDADLSRRAIRYTLEGLSFREYLNFSLGLDIPTYTLDDIIAGKVELPDEVKYPLAHFKEYLSKGYFPFFKQDDYYQRLENVINQTMEVDIPAYAKMNISTARKLKQLLYVVSRSVPFKPKFAEIGNIRETFFYCPLSVNNKVTSSPAADFLVGGHTFEVGGKSKKQKQVKGIEDAFIVKDDIENAYFNIIPLWTFGFNY